MTVSQINIESKQKAITKETNMKIVDKEPEAREGDKMTTPLPPKEPPARRASFTEGERAFLHALFVDDLGDTRDRVEKQDNKTAQALTDDVLFSVPPSMETLDNSQDQTPPKLPATHQKARRRSTVGLWRAHNAGVSPAKLKRKGSLTLPRTTRRDSSGIDANDNGNDDGSDVASMASDVEVRPEKDVDDEVSVASSWDEEADHFDSFDTWKVLQDEYAPDFGFDYDANKVSLEAILNDEETDGNTFRILGTSADDEKCQPHVLSPPLMDALMNFVPTELHNENYWLRYSLVRDGASLETMKQYIRAAKFTLMAIETRTGCVFGSFTSSPWRTNLGFFGGMPSFVWKMRHSRRSKCTSLFEQAQLESEIDVFMCQGKVKLVQMCRHDTMAVGGDDGASDENDGFNVPAAMEDVEAGGFAIALDEDLMCGTTSPSRTFKSPALYGEKGDKTNVFDVAGLEIWSFTPCMDVNAAEKNEMTKYFIEESMRGSSHSAGTEPSFGSRDLSQDRFYRRVGENDDTEERRQRWQYLNTMNPTDGTSRGFGATPRFVS